MNTNAPFRTERLDADVWQVAEESSAASSLDNTERANRPHDKRIMCRLESRASTGFKLVMPALINFSKEVLDDV